MPELPEVEIVCRGLQPALVGRKVERIVTHRPDLRFPLPERFDMRLAGRMVRRLERRAKYIIARFDNGDALVMHLGMTGRFNIEKKNRRTALGEYVYDTGSDPRHDHVELHMSGGTRVVYNDVRRFGFMLLLSDNEFSCHSLFVGLGPEPLSSDLTAAYLSRRAEGKKANLKSFLMDQRVVAGLGNIYVSEALFRAGLDPSRPAKCLASKGGRGLTRSDVLVSGIRSVLSDAIDAGGSTLRDYRHADGAEGAFQESFAVYGRDGEQCVRTGCKGLVRRTVHANRATFYCGTCQK